MITIQKIQLNIPHMQVFHQQLPFESTPSIFPLMTWLMLVWVQGTKVGTGAYSEMFQECVWLDLFSLQQ